jgi:hypothetical protein
MLKFFSPLIDSLRERCFFFLLSTATTHSGHHKGIAILIFSTQPGSKGFRSVKLTTCFTNDCGDFPSRVHGATRWHLPQAALPGAQNGAPCFVFAFTELYPCCVRSVGQDASKASTRVCAKWEVLRKTTTSSYCQTVTRLSQPMRPFLIHHFVSTGCCLRCRNYVIHLLRVAFNVSAATLTVRKVPVWCDHVLVTDAYGQALHCTAMVPVFVTSK